MKMMMIFYYFVTKFSYFFYFTAGAFLATVAGISAFISFGATLSTAKKTDPKYFNKGMF